VPQCTLQLSDVVPINISSS